MRNTDSQKNAFNSTVDWALPNNYFHFKSVIDTIRGADTPHAHFFVQMWYVLNGTYRHHFNGKDYELGKGSLLIVPPMFVHCIDTSKSGEDIQLVNCEFSTDFINSFPDTDEQRTLFNLLFLEPILIIANQAKPFLTFEGQSAEPIDSMFGELRHEYYKRDKFSAVYIRATIIKLLALIAREFEKKTTEEQNALYSKYRAAIQDALDYINTHYTKKIYLDEVCRIALMSSRAFSYIFKYITGRTFTEYVLYLRVMRARELLSTTDRKQFDISRECGFANEYYFHRVFKKITGLLPGEYRKLCRYDTAHE